MSNFAPIHVLHILRNFSAKSAHCEVVFRKFDISWIRDRLTLHTYVIYSKSECIRWDVHGKIIQEILLFFVSIGIAHSSISWRPLDIRNIVVKVQTTYFRILGRCPAHISFLRPDKISPFLSLCAKKVEKFGKL